MPGSAPSALRLLSALLLAVSWLLVASVASVRAGSDGDDPGLVLELDREHYRASVRDVRSGEAGPTIPIVLGSPANPTPVGRHRASWLILRPSWYPAAAALEAGAKPEAASLTTPMGVAKIPFAQGGSIALHGGGDPRLLGQPVSGGCVRAGDADLLRVLAWLDLHHALGTPRLHDDGEIHRPFQRPLFVVVR